MKKFCSLLMCCVMVSALLPAAILPAQAKKQKAPAVYDLDVPVAGQSPDYTALSDGCVIENLTMGAYRGGIAWYDVTLSRFMQTGDVFESGHDYRVDIDVVPPEGDTFSASADGNTSTVKPTVNGEAAAASAYSGVSVKKELMISYTFLNVGRTASGYRIIYNLNYYDKREVDFTDPGGSVPYKIPTRDGYFFDDWFIDEALTEPFDFGSTVSEDTMLYAGWVARNAYCTVLIYADPNDTRPQSYCYVDTGSCFASPDAEARDGKLFMGWYTNRRLTAKYDPNVPLTGSISLFPRYISSTLATPQVYDIYSGRGGVMLRWKEVEAAEKYRVFSKTGGGGWKTLGDVSTTSFLDTSAVSGAAYYYTVRCVSNDGKAFQSGYYYPGWLITYYDMPMVTKTEVLPAGVRVSWGAVTGAPKYRLFVKSEGKSWQAVGDTAGLTLTDTNVTGGVTYTYTVRVIDENGKYGSTFLSEGWSVRFIAPPQITSITNAANGATIKWAASTGASQYRVYYKVSNGWTKIGDTTALTITDTTVKSGETRIYTVRCLSADGKAFESSFISAGWSNTFVAPPTLKTIKNTSSGVRIDWEASAGAQKYRIFRKTGSSTSWQSLGEVDASRLYFVDTTAKNGTSYTYTVRCISSDLKTYQSSFDWHGLTITCSR